MRKKKEKLKYCSSNRGVFIVVINVEVKENEMITTNKTGNTYKDIFHCLFLNKNYLKVIKKKQISKNMKNENKC